MKKITIAIDGFAGCGKSTTAQLVARELSYLYITSGAMYRAVALYFLENNIPFEQESGQIKKALKHIHIDFQLPPGKVTPLTILNNREVEREIRSPEVSEIVSQVSIHPSIRHEMVNQQRRIGKNGGIVMDGRDIGTVVFPKAELKIFMTADVEIRAQRRRAEMLEKGVEISMEEVVKNLKERDRIDSTRAISPLKQADDAIVIDTSHLNIEQQVKIVCSWAWKRIKGDALLQQ